jgi:hypothetical protein
MGGSPLERGERLALALCAGLLAAACASPVSLSGGRWVAAGGASVADLSRIDGAFRQVELEGPLLAYDTASGARASWVHRCPGAVAAARAEAHALLVALEDVAVHGEGALLLAGAEAWLLRADAREAGRAVQLKTVTRVASGCTDDFLLVSPDALIHEAGFDQWWASFEPGTSG